MRQKGLFKKDRRKLSDSEKRDFYYMLQFYLDSGLSINDSLDLIYNDNSFQYALDIKVALNNGSRFMDSLANYHLADEFINSCLLMGENNSSYPKAFRDIVVYLDSRIEDRRYFWKIISYPIFLFLMLFLLTIMLIFFIAPSLNDIFINMGIEMPWSLRFFYGAFERIVKHRKFFYGLMSLFLCFMISGIYKNKLRILIEEHLMKSRLLSKYLQPFVLRSILWQISILLSSGQNISRALVVVSNNMNNHSYREILKEAEGKILEGGLLSELLEAYPEYFPRAVITYIRMGENSGSMEENMENAVSYMDIRCINLADKIKRIAQPLFVGLAGLSIVFLLVLVMPIINSATSFGGI